MLSRNSKIVASVNQQKWSGDIPNFTFPEQVDVEQIAKHLDLFWGVAAIQNTWWIKKNKMAG